MAERFSFNFYILLKNRKNDWHFWSFFMVLRVFWEGMFWKPFKITARLEFHFAAWWMEFIQEAWEWDNEPFPRQERQEWPLLSRKKQSSPTHRKLLNRSDSLFFPSDLDAGPLVYWPRWKTDRHSTWLALFKRRKWNIDLHSDFNIIDSLTYKNRS